MNKNFETELPSGYREAYSIDAKNIKTGVLLNAAGIVLTALLIAAAYFIIKPSGFMENFSFSRYVIALFVLIVYIVAHELTHGAAYKLLTKRKLTFGLSLTVAYCGVPDIYVYRKTALISLLAPFTVFSIVFLCAALLFRDQWDKFYASAVFAIHIGGCSGDLFGTLLYLIRFRDKRTLMRDTGPKQTFYLPE
ncbi:MAG: DUF3267 domain-containing protein [Clostridia bacterium]|nr:DUF3267 domain-containing protein [Clostridia bacterium]